MQFVAGHLFWCTVAASLGQFMWAHVYVGVICGFFFLQAKASACRATFYQNYIGADLFAEIKYGDVFGAFCMLFNVILGKWSKNYFKNVFL